MSTQFAGGDVRNLLLSIATIGLGGSAVLTTLSLFFAENVAATPLLIGVFFAGRALAEIACDAAVGLISDKVPGRRLLLALCALASAIGAFFYIWVRDYTALFVIGAVFFGLGGSTFPQLLAYTREFAEERGHPVTFFNAALRAVNSAAWVVGPPVAFSIVGLAGFEALYCAVMICFLVTAALFAWGMPDTRVRRSHEPGLPRWSLRDTPRHVLVMLAVITLQLAANVVYQINIALYVTRDLALSKPFVGLMLGVGCALEIPLVMYIGAHADRWGKHRVILVGALCAMLFFLLLPLAHTQTALLLLQVPNAVWVAIVLSIPVTYLQDAMPGRVGVASAMYSASFKAGALLGGSVAGAIAQLVGFSRGFWVCAAMAAVSTILLVGRKRVS